MLLRNGPNIDEELILLQTMIISPDAVLAQGLKQALRQFENDLSVCRVLDCYPNPAELVKVLRAHAPSAVFLSFEDPFQAANVAKVLFAEAAGVQVVAVHQNCDPELLRESMRCGIREFLTPPFEQSTISRSLGNVLQKLDGRAVTYAATDQVLAFLPSKAGVGATSLALNISAALAREPASRVVLADLDLNSGALRFLLNLKSERSIMNAAVHAEDMNEQVWPAFVTAFGNLDVLHAGSVNPAARLDSARLPKLIQFLRRNYQAVCFDLSGNLERYSIDVMQEVRSIILVCTPEIPSLHLAREKMAFLHKAGLKDRVLLVLNRVTRQAAFNKGQVEDLLEVPVFATFSNDYAAFNQAASQGKALDLESHIGKECLAFANKLLKKAAPPKGRHKFLQSFWVHSPETESYPT